MITTFDFKKKKERKKMKLNSSYWVLLIFILNLNLITSQIVNLSVIKPKSLNQFLGKKYDEKADSKALEIIFDPGFLSALIYALELIYWTFPGGFLLGPLFAIFNIPMNRMEKSQNIEAVLAHFNQNFRTKKNSKVVEAKVKI